MIALNTASEIDDLIQWMCAQGATSTEISAALIEAGHDVPATRVTLRAAQMNLALAKRPASRRRRTAWPGRQGTFTLRPAVVTDRLCRLAELADTPAGLTLEQYERAKARILGEK